MLARRAWKDSKLEQEEISRNRLLSGKPDFEVVGLGGGEAHVAGAEAARGDRAG